MPVISKSVLIVALLATATLVDAAQGNEPEKVTPETYIRAETDFAFADFQKNAGGKINAFYYITKPTPLNEQPVVRMNKDTLYAAAVVDTEGGATITIPEFPDGRYFSILVIDNDHYCPTVFYEPGIHKIPGDTKYVAVVQRIQMMDPSDPEDVALVNKLQKQFKVTASSADSFPAPKWDKNSMLSLRAQYEKEFQKFDQYEPDWMGPRGKVNEATRHLAAAGAWGLFPEKDAVYINYTGPADAGTGYMATYKVPENDAFWSITVYDKDGFMKSENNIVNDRNVTLNDDGTFTVYFGPKEVCGDKPNRLDITEGWNFLMRVYRPGESILQREYKLPPAKPVTGSGQVTGTAETHATPADFGVTDFAYKVSETDFNITRSLAKAPVNEWAHQNDVNNVETQQVIRENQDVIYSSAVVDISKGATFSVPRSETYHIIEIIDLQNYIVDVVYPGKSIAVSPDDVTYGNYVYLNMRIRKLPPEKGGLEATHRLQRMAKIDANSALPYTTPDIVIDQQKLEEIRMALIKDVQDGKLPDTSRAQGSPFTTEPQDHLYATAYGWGGLSIEHAAYLPITNQTKIVDGKIQPSSLTFVPPDIDAARGGFWSITTYNSEGWLAMDKASISDSEAVANNDGSYTIHFNSPGEKNNIDTPTPFAALLRIYVPKSKTGIVTYLPKASQELVIK